MNFIKNTGLLIVSPANGWKDISKYKIPKDLILRKLYYPLLAILALTSFVGFFYSGGKGLAFYIQFAAINFARYFFGYLISIFLISNVIEFKEEGKSISDRLHVFVLYNYSILVIIEIIENILPIPSAILDLLPLYLIYVIWKGMKFLKIENGETKFLILSSIIILLPPFLLKFILNLLLPNNI